MSTATATVNCQIGTDAHFRAWCQAINDQLSALGLVKETVTGEINLGTVTKPSPSFATYPYDGFDAKGFQIWRFNDVLQTNFPVFVKIEYGGQALASPWWTHTGPGIAVTIAAAHSGSTMTTQATARKTVYMDSGASQLCHFSGSSSRFAFECGKAMFFSIERFKDAGGGDTGRGVLALAAGWYAVDGGTLYGMTSRWQMAMLPTGTNPTPETQWRALIPTVDDGMVDTNAVGFTVHPLTPRMEQACLGALLYFDGDLADLTSYSVSVAGRQHTYLAFDEFAYLTGERPSETRLAMRYE